MSSNLPSRYEPRPRLGSCTDVRSGTKTVYGGNNGVAGWALGVPGLQALMKDRQCRGARNKWKIVSRQLRPSSRSGATSRGQSSPKKECFLECGEGIQYTPRSMAA